MHFRPLVFAVLCGCSADQLRCDAGYTRVKDDSCTRTVIADGPEYDTAAVGGPGGGSDIPDYLTTLTGVIRLSADAESLTALQISVSSGFGVTDEGQADPDSPPVATLDMDAETITQEGVAFSIVSPISPREQTVGLYIFALPTFLDPLTGLAVEADPVEPLEGNPSLCTPDQECGGVDFTL